MNLCTKLGPSYVATHMIVEDHSNFLTSKIDAVTITKCHMETIDMLGMQKDINEVVDWFWMPGFPNKICRKTCYPKPVHDLVYIFFVHDHSDDMASQ